MGKMRSFKQEFSFEERSEESRDMIAKYPDRVPVVVERYSNTDLPEIEKKKYLVPRDMSVGQFIHILSCRLRLAPGKALFVFVNSTLPQTSSLMESVYKTLKEEDGFLYMCYSSEKTFGCDNSQTCGCTSLYLVPRDMSVGQFIHILSCRLRLAPGKALFVFVNSTLPQTSSLMESVYKTFKEEDGFLYMCYSSEKTFGCGNSQTCGCTSL